MIWGEMSYRRKQRKYGREQYEPDVFEIAEAEDCYMDEWEEIEDIDEKFLEDE